MKYAWKLVNFKTTVLVSKLITNNISIRVCRWQTCGFWWWQWRSGYYYIPPVSRSSHVLFEIVYCTAVLMSLCGRYKLFSAECHCLPPHWHLGLQRVKSHSVLIINFVPSQSPYLVRFPTQRDLLPYPVLTATVIYFVLSPSSDNSSCVRRHISAT